MFRSILAALVVALFATPALADVGSCYIVSNAINPTEAGATDDIINLADGSFSATAANEDEFVVPVRVEATNLRVDVDVAPSANDTWLISVADDGTATPLSCSITGTATSCASFSGATLAAGSDVTVIVDSSTGTADPDAAAEIRFSFCLNPR
jgi:hypothetical protein